MPLSEQDYLTIHAITVRAKETLQRRGDTWSLIGSAIDFEMDIENTHRECPLDLSKLLASNDRDFVHDVVGIFCNFDRPTKTMQNLFSPRATA